MSGFKLIAFIFPFIKEMVLGEKTVREALKTNKMKVAVLTLIMLSFFLNIVFIPKFFKVAAEYVMLEKKYKENSTGPQKTPVVPAVPAPKPKEPKEQPKPVKEPEKHEEPQSPSSTQVMQHQGGADAVVTDVPPEPPSYYSGGPPKHPAAPRSTKNETRRTHKPPPNLHGNSPEAIRRYQEWKKSFDDIKAREEIDRWDPPDTKDLYRH
jgi:hypothetical protein